MRSKSNYIDPQQFDEIITAIPFLQIRKWNNIDVEYLFKISYWCGLRMKEACKLKKEDFDLYGNEVYLGLTKKKKNQYAPIPLPFLPELKSYLATKQNGQLLPNCNPQIVRIWVRRLGKKLDVAAWTTPQEITGEKTLTHIFRKSIAKSMLYGVYGKKAPLNVVQKQLRHSSLGTTSKYLQVGIEDVKDWWETNI